MKILGREPAILIGFIGAVLSAVAAMNVEWLSAGQAAALTAALAALLIAAATRPIGPALFVAAFVAVATLFAEYGLNLSEEIVAAVSAAILAGAALFGIRPQVTPNHDPTPIAPASGSVR